VVSGGTCLRSSSGSLDPSSLKTLLPRAGGLLLLVGGAPATARCWGPPMVSGVSGIHVSEGSAISAKRTPCPRRTAAQQPAGQQCWC